MLKYIENIKKIGKQPPLKLKSAKTNPRYIQDIQDKYKIPSGRAGLGRRPLGILYLFWISWIYLGFIFADFNLSGGCFPIF